MIQSEELGFWREQGRRLALRWIVVWYALVSLAFWTAAVLIAAWLRHAGLGVVVALAGSVWLYFALPTMYVHAQLIVDVIGYVITQRTYFYPVLIQRADLTEDDVLKAMDPPVRALFVKLKPYFVAASFTSPFVGPATWALIVLARMPSEAHLPRHASRAELRNALRVGRRIEMSVSEGYAERLHALVA